MAVIAVVLAIGVAAAWIHWTRASAAGVSNVARATPENEGLNILERPIPFGAKRQELTLEYIRTHYNPGATDIVIDPRVIVIHWTGSFHAAFTFAAFYPEALPFWRRDIQRGGRVNVSAHFLIDRDGTTFRLMPEDWMARHVIGLNPVAIGIENVGGPTHPLTDTQLRSNARLVRYLVTKNRGIQFLIGHHEYGRFRGTTLWKERDPTYFTGKQDPGPDFMARLRAEVKDLSLAASA
ncbi:MAG: peptidoglycan recognition protein family protein [Pseudomonadota bacterium]|nr:peptidoglycan recognition protein family protein [Pseudomonadota bacterium]